MASTRATTITGLKLKAKYASTEGKLADSIVEDIMRLLSTGNRRPEFTVPTKTSPRLQSLSVIATPPARRLPVRTAIGFWDPPTVARALRYGAPARRSKLSCLSPHTSRTSLRCDGRSSRRLLLCAVERFQGLNGLLYPFFDRGKHGEHRFVMGKDGTHRFVLVG